MFRQCGRYRKQICLITLLILNGAVFIYLQSSRRDPVLNNLKEEKDYPRQFGIQKSQLNQIKLTQKETLINTWSNFDTSKCVKVTGHQRNKPGFLTIGIPTVRRANGLYYVLTTLQSIVSNTTEEEKSQVTVVIFLADFDPEYHTEAIEIIQEKYQHLIDSGFIQIIEANKEFYPRLEGLKRNFNDSALRVYWRSKQNVDFAVMFLYVNAMKISKYYIQLEDDVYTSERFVEDIRNFIKRIELQRKQQWVVLEFSILGFIGKLFPTDVLGKFGRYLLMFYDEQPVDWLVIHFRDSMSQFKSFIRTPTLFQHLGVQSSLSIKNINQGNHSKNSTLLDDFFVPFQVDIEKANPPANITRDIEQFKAYDFNTLYRNREKAVPFWGVNIKGGQSITLVFHKPFLLQRLLITTGSCGMPQDILESGRVEISGIPPQGSKNKCGQFTKLASFHNGKIDLQNLSERVQSKINCLRILVTGSQKNWLIMRHFYVIPAE